MAESSLHPWQITDTYELLGVVERIKPPASYLVDMWFPNMMPVSYSTWVSVEYTKQGRQLAPYVVRGGKGVDIARGKSKIASYRPPMVGVRRTIGLGDIEQRMIGEQPIFSTVRPEERAAQMQANDLVELLRLIQNRKNKMAADILTTGKTKIKGYADDAAQVVEEDEIIFDWNGIVPPQKNWDQSGALIYDDLKAASERIQEDSGYIPTLMLCGRNVERYLLNNDELLKWMALPNRQNISMLSFTPHYTTPQARFVGYLSSLNLEIISYSETYMDEDTGEVKSFLDPDTVIIGNPGRGRQLYGAITYMNQAGQWQTVAANNVPVYLSDFNAQQSSLAIFSRFLLVPETFDDHLVIPVLSAADEGDTP